MPGHSWCLVTWLCTALCDPLDCSPPGSTVRGVFQARILEWVAIFFSWGSSCPRAQTHISCVSYITGAFFICWAIWEAQTFFTPKLKTKFTEDTMCGLCKEKKASCCFKLHNCLSLWILSNPQYMIEKKILPTKWIFSFKQKLSKLANF